MGRRLPALIVLTLAACSEPVVYVGAGADPAAAPPTWQEHWFEHTQQLELAASDEAVLIYFDKDVDRAQAPALLAYVSKIWKYTTATYGPVGPGRLNAIFHKDRHLGCHSANYFSASHDYRNVIDCGSSMTNDPTVMQVFLPHLAAVLVESGSHGRDGTPADPIWHQGKWAEFFRYDLYVGTGMTSLAEEVFADWTSDGATDPFPAADTHWFRDWSYPLWRDHGGAMVMNRFFALLARDFPADGVRYARNLKWGEFIHFMSGAATTDLKPLATAAFGWPVEWEQQLQEARRGFPQIAY